jgi:hypothetical protein
VEQNTLITRNNKSKKIKVLFLKMISNPKDNKTLRNLMAKFHKDRIVWIIVFVKKAHNYIPRAKVMEPIEPKVKGKPVVELMADNKVDKANKIDLPLNSLLVNGINNIKVIIKKEPQLSLVIRFSKPKKV